jgi:iron complex transport system ATP-binding protein
MELARLLSVVLTERVDVGTLSVYALVGLGRYPYTDWSGVLTEQDEKVVRWAVESVGAVDLAHRNVGELSDGERQKVMIARALAQEPAVMLLDEPTAFLDLPRRVEIMQMLRQLVRDTGRTVLLSTHDLDLALRSADRIWLMPHDAPMQVGAPEDLVLNGAFESAFHSEGVIFDPETGSFRIHRKQGGEIVLRGDEGIAMIWTRRALEREGFAVVPVSESGLVIEVFQLNDGPSWRLCRDESRQQYTSLYDLIAALRQV